MQRGVDLWAGECVLDLMGENDIHLIAAIPYKDFGKNYQAQDKWLFGRITDSAGAFLPRCRWPSRAQRGASPDRAPAFFISNS